MQNGMTSMERVLTTLRHKEPDRVPFFLLLTMHGAKELGLSIKDYFSKATNIAEGQLRLREKYKHDCLTGVFYAAVEIEAWGGEVIFRDDGPPNSGEPFIKSFDQIKSLEPPVVKNCKSLVKVLEAQAILKEKAAESVPVIGSVISPFSLPVMQMGFERYIEFLYEPEESFERLMKVNEEFCVQWANAQLDAGCAAICYTDAVSSSSIIPREMYLSKGFEIARRTIARIKGPTATNFASGRSIPILPDVARTGTAAVGVSVFEDMAEIKKICRGKLTVIGNLNGVEMRRWSAVEAETAVKNVILKAGGGGGFILSDNHGEIPFQVPDGVLHAISDAVHRWGMYPLQWIE